MSKTASWKVLFPFPTTGPYVSPTFSFQKVEQYLKLVRNSDNTYELILNRSDHSQSLNEPFDVEIRLENTISKSDVLSRVTVRRIPQALWTFTWNVVCRFCDRIHDTNLPNCSYETRIVCCFNTGTSSESKGTNLATESNDLDFPPNLESLSLDFSNLLKNKTLPDLKLRCGDRVVPAHRSVLAARSEVFAAMLSNEMSESRTGAVDVEDVEDGVLDLFLQYVYAGKIAAVPDDAVPDLYAAADKYAVNSLKTSCRERMISRLTVQNCVSLLTVADAHSDVDFKKAVILFICSHDSVFKSDD